MRNRIVHALVAMVVAFAAPVAAEQLPQLDPAVQLGVCQQQRAIFLSDSEQAQTLMRQLVAERDKLKAEIEALKAQVKPE